MHYYIITHHLKKLSKNFTDFKFCEYGKALLRFLERQIIRFCNVHLGAGKNLGGKGIAHHALAENAMNFV